MPCRAIDKGSCPRIHRLDSRRKHHSSDPPSIVVILWSKVCCQGAARDRAWCCSGPSLHLPTCVVRSAMRLSCITLTNPHQLRSTSCLCSLHRSNDPKHSAVQPSPQRSNDARACPHPLGAQYSGGCSAWIPSGQRLCQCCCINQVA